VTSSFQNIAERRGLPAFGALVGELEWDVEKDGYLRIPLVDDVEGILTLMRRRGLDPELVNALLDQFPARPLERALIAWDVARWSLFDVDDGAYAQRIAAELAPLAPIAPTVSVAVHRERVAALIEAARPSIDIAPELMDDFETPTPSLAAVLALRMIRDRLENDDPLAVEVTNHVKRLVWAHLPSLALAFLQILHDQFAVPHALDLMIEIAADHHLWEALPDMPGQDDRSMQQQAYLLLRMQLGDYGVVRARRLHDALNQHPAVQSSMDPSVILARAELALLENKRFDAKSVELLHAIAPAESAWRYAVEIRESVDMVDKPYLAASAVEGFIAKFGNSFRLWARAWEHAAARAELVRLLSREVRYLPHDPEAWLLASTSADGFRAGLAPTG
jgi:hypothetical protein